jgi:hypothetical protein
MFPWGTVVKWLVVHRWPRQFGAHGHVVPGKPQAWMV